MTYRRLFAALALALLPVCATAGPISINFVNSLVNAAPATTATFRASLLNTTSSPVNLDIDALNVQAPLTGNDTKFFLNFPASLAGFATTATAPIFDITVPGGTAYGLYTGHFEIRNTAGVAGAADFAVNVVPEPGTLACVVLGCLALVRRVRR